MPITPNLAPADGIQRDLYTGMAGEIVADDLCVYEQISAPWEVLTTPKDRKPFGHRKSYLISPSVILYRESFDSSIHSQGLTPAGMLCVSLPLRLGAHSSYWNASPREAALPASLPGALDVVLDAGQEHLIVLVNLVLIRKTWPAYIVRSIEHALASRWLPAHSGAVERLASWLLMVLETAHQQPECFRQSASVHAFEAELLDRLAQTVQLPPAKAIRSDATHRERGLARAIEYMRENDAALVTVPQLCLAANVSQRTLEYAFRDAFGLTPIGYLRLHRFHLARNCLLAARPERESVTNIAYRAGFFELGRFSGTYRSLFGERPSDTLRRCSPAGQGLPPSLQRIQSLGQF
jgi:AraC family ethanolamine operon transcriptional activator